MSEMNPTPPPTTPPGDEGNQPPPQANEPPKDDQKPDEGKSEEGKSEEPKAEPITAEALKIPEGFTVEDEQMSAFLDIFNGDKSPAERAQALVDFHADQVRQASEKMASDWKAQQDTWVEDIKKEQGQKFQESVDSIGKLMDQYATDELREVLAITGAGNNPHVFNFLLKISKDLSEGGPVSAQPANTQKSPAEILYPSQGKD